MPLFVSCVLASLCLHVCVVCLSWCRDLLPGLVSVAYLVFAPTLSSHILDFYVSVLGSCSRAEPLCHVLCFASSAPVESIESCSVSVMPCRVFASSLMRHVSSVIVLRVLALCFRVACLYSFFVSSRRAI